MCVAQYLSKYKASHQKTVLCIFYFTAVSPHRLVFDVKDIVCLNIKQTAFLREEYNIIYKYVSCVI